MQINEIFASIDGEGIRTGYLTTFIRSFACNLLCHYCFGVKPGRHVPTVFSVKSISNEGRKNKVGHNRIGNKIPINEVKVGDNIYTYDSDLNIVTTTVTNIISREVTEWYELGMNGTVYYVTPEHPIFTTSGMKLVKDLKVGDIVLHSTEKQLRSISKSIYNPMKNPEIAYKSAKNTDYKKMGSTLSATIRQKQLQGTYKSTWELMSDAQKAKICKQSSLRMLRENNPNWVENYPYRNYGDLKKAITKNPSTFNCELCGCNGNDVKLFVHHIDHNRENDSMNNLSVVCSRCHNQIHERGYNFWTENRKDGKISLAAIYNANGIEVKSINHVDIKNNKYYGKTYGPKPLKVFNLSCAPYNTYFMDTMWVHNCDTLYAVKPESEEDKANAFKTMSVDEIVAECERLGNKRITFTGGEPLIQKDAIELINALTEKGYEVNIETNGAVDLLPFIQTLKNQHNIIFTMDWKSPYSGMRPRMIESNLGLLEEKDVLKFVVANEEDLNDMLDIVSNHTLDCSVFVSPVFGNIEGKDIVKFLQEHNLQNVRVQVQLHKYFWRPEMRGV